MDTDTGDANANLVISIPYIKETTSNSPLAMSMVAKNVTSIPKLQNNPLKPIKSQFYYRLSFSK